MESAWKPAWRKRDVHETLQDVVVAPGPGGLVMTAGEDVIPVDIGPLAGATRVD